MAGESRAPKIDDSTVKLYIGGIDPGWSSDKIIEILSNHGNVKRADVVKNFAFAFVDNQTSADNIIKELSGTTIEGNRIVIQISKNKQNLPDCDELCFECGEPGHWAKECTQRRRRLAKRGEPPMRGRPPMRGGPPSRGGPHSRGGPRDYPSDRPGYDRLSLMRAQDPYARQYEERARAMYSRDPYARDPYSRDPYARDPYGRDPYPSYAATSRYDYDRYDPTRAYASSAYRERSPTSAYAAYRRGSSPTRTYVAADPYAANRERLAYGRAVVADMYEPRRPLDPYESARRALDTLDSYEALRRTDPYNVPGAMRVADPYLPPSRERYTSDIAVASKRFPEAAYPPGQRQ